MRAVGVAAQERDGALEPGALLGADEIQVALRLEIEDVVLDDDAVLAAARVARGPVRRCARRVGTRMFHRDGERWIDSRMKSDLRVYKVKAYSPAYFALIEKLPELRDAFAIGDRVVVAGRSVAVEVVEDAAELSATELESIVRNW